MSDDPYESSDSVDSNESSEEHSPRFPPAMLAITVIFVGGVSAARTFLSEIEDRFSIGLDVINLATMVGTASLVLLWSLWFLAFSRWRWSSRLVSAGALVATPFLFFGLFRPVGGGDVDFLRFEPRWAKRPELVEVESVEMDVKVDLETETPGDYPRFMGSSIDAAVAGKIDSAQFESSAIEWKQPIGLGWSAFAARNGFAVTMEQRGTEECVTCYSIKSGELLWVYRNPARHRDVMNLGHIGPRSTPTIHEGKVYAMGAVGNFVCLDGSDGSPIWQVDLNELLGIKLVSTSDNDGFAVAYEGNSSLAWGRSGAPLIVGELVLIPGGGPREGKKSTLLAFNRETGELVWRAGDDGIGYGSPSRVTVAGVDQILLVGETTAFGFQPESGEVLWTHDRPGMSDQAANTSQISVVSGTDLLISKGYPDGGGERLHFERTDDGALGIESKWQSNRSLKTKLTSPVIHNGYAYAISNGFMECTDLETGDRVWKRRGRFGHGQILLVGDQILIHSESGTLHLIDASPDGYEEHGKIETIDGICWNFMCLYEDRLLVRSDIEAACVLLPVKRPLNFPEPEIEN